MDRLAKYRRTPYTFEQLQMAGKYLLLLDVEKVEVGAGRAQVVREWVALRDLYAEETEREWMEVLSLLEVKRCELNRKATLREEVLRECPWLTRILQERERWEEKRQKEVRARRLKLNLDHEHGDRFAMLKGKELEEARLAASARPFRVDVKEVRKIRCRDCGAAIELHRAA